MSSYSTLVFHLLEFHFHNDSLKKNKPLFRYSMPRLPLFLLTAICVEEVLLSLPQPTAIKQCIVLTAPLPNKLNPSIAEQTSNTLIKSPKEKWYLHSLYPQ